MAKLHKTESGPLKQPIQAGPICVARVIGSSLGSTRVAFVTANLVARVSGYRFELARWGDQHKQTVATTDAAAWSAICREISVAGFRAVEVWEAHAAPEVMNRERGATWPKWQVASLR